VATAGGSLVLYRAETAHVAATAAGVTTPAPFDVTVAPAAASTFAVGAPAGSTAGSAFAVTVTAKDPYGNTATGYTGTVHLASGDGQAVLPADAAATAGVVTFTAVQLGTAGLQSLT